MALAIIDHKNLKLNFSGAYNPLYIIRDNELIILKATRNPVGNYISEKPLVSEYLDLKKNARIYMFSDGFIDQLGGKEGRKFWKKIFKSFIIYGKRYFSME